jgi:hypothetical protein
MSDRADSGSRTLEIGPNASVPGAANVFAVSGLGLRFGT